MPEKERGAVAGEEVAAVSAASAVEDNNELGEVAELEEPRRR